MFELKSKTILIISPQSWGKMFVSKHHYAVELAKKGNCVFFLNPPDAALKERILIKPVEETPGLVIVSHRLNFPYNIKFHAIVIFHWLMKLQVKKILRAIEEPVDIVWSFDLGNLYPFKLFPRKALRIFHPVDEPLNATALASAKGAQIIFSVTQEILDKYKDIRVPCHFINHGVNEIFFRNNNDAVSSRQKIHVGYSGNLLRSDIDRPIFIQIIKENPDVLFECWGSYQLKDANLGGGDIESLMFIKTLRGQPNVLLHGSVGTEELVSSYKQMDAFLICYDVIRDQSKGTNYHKVMEFLSIGKVIISNNITTFSGMNHLINMVAERGHNNELPGLFKKIILNLHLHNSVSEMQKRIDYAQMHIYIKQIKKIETLINFSIEEFKTKIHCS